MRRVLFVLLLLPWACSTLPGYTPRPGRYDRMPEGLGEPLWAARRALDREDYRQAYDLVLPLVREFPWLMPLRIDLQELQLGLLLRGEKVGLGLALPDGSNYPAELGDRYRQRAVDNPSPVEYVLAARLASNREEAEKLISEAVALDAGCAWAYYARAWWDVQERRFPEAREAVAQVFAIDPGHLPTMRLHASLLAAAGETPEAMDCLRKWLERTLDDPLVDPSFYAEAQVDLAILHVLSGDDRAALRVLEGVQLEVLLDPARTELVRSVAYAGRGQTEAALRSAEHAAAMDARGLLPLAYRAILLQRSGDLEAERQAWIAVLDQAKGELAPQLPGGPESSPPVDFTSLLLELRAHARLGRIERQLAAAATP